MMPRIYLNADAVLHIDLAASLVLGDGRIVEERVSTLALWELDLLEHGGVVQAMGSLGGIQRGDIIFPKSVTRSRVQENFDIFDFELSPDDMAAIDGLNKNKRRGPDPDTFNYVP